MLNDFNTSVFRVDLDSCWVKCVRNEDKYGVRGLSWFCSLVLIIFYNNYLLVAQLHLTRIYCSNH